MFIPSVNLKVYRILSVLLVSIFPLTVPGGMERYTLTAELQAAPRRPSYDELYARLPEIWAQRYPVRAEGFEFYSSKSYRILQARVSGKNVYYYRYIAIIPIMTRESGDTMSKRESRKAEFWVRYRSWLDDPFDVTFARNDLLPGSSRRWVR